MTLFSRMSSGGYRPIAVGGALQQADIQGAVLCIKRPSDNDAADNICIGCRLLERIRGAQKG